MNMKLLEELSDVQGVAGYEELVQKTVTRELLACCEEVNEDRMGNIIGVKRAGKKVSGDRPPRVMLCAHCDESGFMVREVTAEGYVRLRGVSGPNNQTVIGQQVRIAGTETVCGVLVPTKPDLTTFPKIEDLLLDTGRDVEWVKKRVRVGDRATFDISLSKFNGSIITGRNFDDRLGVFCMIEAMKAIQKASVSVDIYAVSSVQEEIGTRGAMVASNAIKPDIGIALDGGCIECPTFGRKDGWTSKIGGGVAIYQADGLTVCSKTVNEFLQKLAGKEKIPCHDNWHGGTDAHQMQKQGNGAYVTTIGVPTGYMHWPHALADLGDVQAVIDLLKAFLVEAHKIGVSTNPWRKL
jgi:tetrahedral aminopeptidase